MKQSELDSINLDIETAKKELAQYEGIDKKNQFDEKLEINTVQDINRVKYIYYSAIGANMPKDTWLIYLKIYDNKKIDIIGRSTSVENVYKFYKGIKMSVINSDLRLSRLEMSADTIGNLAIEDYNTIKPKFYEFEITNFTDSELKAQEDALNPSSNKNDNQDNNSSNTSAKRRKGFLFEDFLSQPGDSESITSGKAPKVNLPNIGSQGTPDAPPKELPANLESIEKF